MTDAVSLLLALLTAFGQAGLILGFALFVASRFSQRVHAVWSTVADSLAPAGLWMAWAVAAVATAGSLYFSEAAGYTPCELCWYQRIALYPLVVVLGVAAYRRDVTVGVIAAPLALAGSLISAYHYQLQRWPAQASEFCDPANPCSLTWVWELNYVSIPMMAFTAGALITALVTLVYMRARSTDDQGATNAGA